MLERSVKIILAGESNVGKTSLIERLCNSIKNNHWEYYYEPDTTLTIGGAYSSVNVKHNNMNIKLDIWDTAGQERYYSLAQLYFRKAHYCILVFDVNNPQSFEKIIKWKQACEEAVLENNDEPYFILVGNKIDKEQRKINPSAISILSQEYNILYYFETSAYTGKGIEKLYQFLIKHIINHQKNNYVEANIIDVKPSNNYDKYCNC